MDADGSIPSRRTIRMSRDSQGGQGGGLKNLKCQFDSDSRHSAVVVQLVERFLAKEEVEGSNPFHRS